MTRRLPALLPDDPAEVLRRLAHERPGMLWTEAAALAGWRGHRTPRGVWTRVVQGQRRLVPSRATAPVAPLSEQECAELLGFGGGR